MWQTRTRRANLRGVYLEPGASRTMSVSPDDDPDSTEESDGEYDSELDCDVDIRMEDDVDAPDGVDLDSDVDMEWESGDEEQKDEEKVDEEKEDEEEKDGDEDDCKEPRTIGQEAMVNTSADDRDTIVDDQPIRLPKQDQEKRVLTRWAQPPCLAQRPQTPEPRPQPQTPETHPYSGLEHLWLVTLQNHRPAVPALREAEAAQNTSDVDVDKQVATVPLTSLSPMSLSWCKGTYAGARQYRDMIWYTVAHGRE